MRNIFQAMTIAEAALVRNLLVTNGIEARLVEGQAPHANLAISEVWVPDDEDADRAIALVRDLLAARPEGAPWSCERCGESNPRTFEVCWQCGAEH